MFRSLGYMLNKKIDMLHEKIYLVIILLSLPLFINLFIEMGVGLLNNTILVKYMGEGIFAIVSSITMLNGCLASLCGAIRNGAYVRSAKNFSTKEVATKYMIQNIYTIAVFDFVFCGLLIIFVDPILIFLNVKPELYDNVKIFFIGYYITYFFVDLLAQITTINNANSSSVRIFILGAITSLLSTLITFIVIGPMSMGVLGYSLLGLFKSLPIFFVYIFLLSKAKIFGKVKKEYFKPDFKFIFGAIGYGATNSIQSVTVTVGEIFVLRQTNLLPIDYITCLSISLPFTISNGPLFSAITLFVPINFQNGNVKRIKSFLRLNIIVCFVIGLVNCTIYWIVSKPYLTGLGLSASVINYGIEYWWHMGIQSVLISLLQPMRNYFEAVGYNVVNLIEGFFEVAGKFICAFILIPKFGVLGRNVSWIVSWVLGNIELYGVYFIFRKKIYEKCRSYRKTDITLNDIEIVVE